MPFEHGLDQGRALGIGCTLSAQIPQVVIDARYAQTAGVRSRVINQDPPHAFLVEIVVGNNVEHGGYHGDVEEMSASSNGKL
ncbi:unnamed protein product [Clonostachys rhizophaga]|uniref:Uncharacterized protein n=1 Tax=Clonostachys rhizophaga TaxID=160324 RepID=A0A9N9VWA7_9HYPO|nr:unnamed protein product [Clonostachys rhizophaga]